MKATAFLLAALVPLAILMVLAGEAAYALAAFVVEYGR